MSFLDECEQELQSSPSKVEQITKKVPDFFEVLDMKLDDGSYRFSAPLISRNLKQKHGISISPNTILRWRQERAT